MIGTRARMLRVRLERVLPCGAYRLAPMSSSPRQTGTPPSPRAMPMKPDLLPPWLVELPRAMHSSGKLGFIALSALSLSLTACTSDTIRFSKGCHVALSSLTPSQAYPAEQVTIQGAPFTTAYDTAVYLDTERAEVVDVLRQECEACESCFTANNCLLCSDCDECDLDCSTCVETVVFSVPNLSPRDYEVRLWNRHGQSNALTLQIQGNDTGLDDTSDKDTADSGKDTADSGKDTADSGKDTADTSTGDSGDSGK